MAVVLGLGVAAALLILYTTSDGPWAWSDSVGYLVAARSLVEGNGLGWTYPSGEFYLATHFPPLYSLALALCGLGGVDLVNAARFIAVASAAVAVSTTAATTLVATGLASSALAVAMAILWCPVVLHILSGAMSEPLFLAFQAAGILLLLHHVRTARIRWVAMAGLALGCAAATRYVGIALVVGGALGILALGRNSRRGKLVAAGVFTAFGVMPSLLWLILILLSRGAPALPREALVGTEGIWTALSPFRVAVVDELWAMLPVVGSAEGWTYRARLAVLLGLALSGGGVTWWASRAWRRIGEEVRETARGGLDLAGYSLLLAACYLGGLAGAFLLVRPAPDIDSRMLVPVRFLLWQGTAGAAYLVGSLSVGLSWLRRAPVVLAAAAMAWATPSTLAMARTLSDNAASYTGGAWRESCLVQQAREVPAELQLISNDSAAILFLAGRPAHDVPELLNHERRVPFRRFGDNAGDSVEAIFRQGKAALVLFSSAYWQFEAIYHQEAEARLEAFVAGLETRTRCPDGEILYYPSVP